MADEERTRKTPPSRLIVELTLKLWDTVLNGAGIGRAYYDYMKIEPSAGDLVLELSTAYVRLREHDKPEGQFNSGGLGYFDHKELEPIENAEAWAAENPDENVPLEMYWYVHAFDTGELLRWHNCRFIRVPVGLIER